MPVATLVNPFAVSQTEPFVIGKSDLAFFSDNPYRCETGTILFCVRGCADLTIDLRRETVRPRTVVFLLPGSVVIRNAASADFEVMFGVFAAEMFGEAGFRLGPSFLGFLKENPVFHATEAVAEGWRMWFEIMGYTYRDRENVFRKTIVRNRLQNLMLEVYDKIQRRISSQSPTASDRQTELFRKFIALVHEYCFEQREVAYYADRLCISTRYLSAIVRRTVHQSAKELIDKIVVMEIKVLLQSTTLPIQEIAYKMHFPDQSYLGRYFKKHTGVSPTTFRQESR